MRQITIDIPEDLPESANFSSLEAPAAIFMLQIARIIRPLLRFKGPDDNPKIFVWIRVKDGMKGFYEGDKYNPLSKGEEPLGDPGTQYTDTDEEGWFIMNFSLADFDEGSDHGFPCISFFSKDFEGDGDKAKQKFQQLFEAIIRLRHILGVPDFDVSRVERAIATFASK